MKVSLFVTCLGDTLFPDVGEATVTVLERLGCEVEFRPEQTCCGQMHLNSGYPDEARTLVEGFSRTFADAEAIVLPSGSCAGMLRHHGPGLVGHDVPPVYELSEFLIDVLGVTDVGAVFPHTVTYHPTCHSLRLLGVGDRPYRLLRAVQGLELVDLPESDQCCGFGGTFAIKNAEVSSAMGEDKIHNAKTSGAEILCASDASCLMHMQGILDKQRTRLPRTMHLAEILASTR